MWARTIGQNKLDLIFFLRTQNAVLGKMNESGKCWGRGECNQNTLYDVIKELFFKVQIKKKISKQIFTLTYNLIVTITFN